MFLSVLGICVVVGVALAQWPHPSSWVGVLGLVFAGVIVITQIASALRHGVESSELYSLGGRYDWPDHNYLRSRTSDYDEYVRQAFSELVRTGQLLFNPPDHMQLGHTERVEVRVARTLELNLELLEHLRGHGEPHLEEVLTAPIMAVTLKGDGFRITAYSDEEQSVTTDSITSWEFDIYALIRGRQRLVLSVSLRIPVVGQRLEHKNIPVREAMIDVQVGIPTRVGYFVSSNWQWFVGTAIAIAAVVVAVLYH